MTKGTEHVLDRPDILSVLFYPRRDVGIPRLGAGMHTVRMEVAEGIHVGGRVFSAPGKAPVILYFHGNGEIASDYEAIAPFYTRLGLTLFVVDYRGYGLSDGSPTASALLADALAVFRRTAAVLGELAIAHDRLFLMGRSLGSAAALEIASLVPDGVAGLILESGFAYTFPLIERIGQMQFSDADEERDGFGNLAKVRKVRVPTLILHGERDWIIPVGDGIALYDACAAEDKRLLTIPGAGHNDLMLVGQRQYFSAIAEFCGKGGTSD